MDLNALGRILIGVGILVAAAGLFMVGISRLTGGQAWRLPGDVLIRRDNVTIYIPIATSILISVLLMAILYLVSLLSRR